jgi:glyoxylase-like metal-dependent hydrolase (beta-lactamase superfamily II)
MDSYQVYAVRYGTRAARRREHFIFGDDHDGPMPMDYYIWAISSENRTVVVDTGFNQADGARRGREFLLCPSEGLAMIGIDARRVSDVIITHLHYDHAGNLGRFPEAKFHLQDLELSYATGRSMTHGVLRSAYTVDDVVETVSLVYADRVVFHQGDDEIAPGISVHHIGGHTRGLQVVRVFTARGWLMLASDASHYYANMEEGNPFPIVENVADMLEGHRRLETLADSDDHIVPGHDPEVMRRYPSPSTESEGIVACLHEAPLHDV